MKKEKLLALEQSSYYRHECGICDCDYMLRRGCQCRRGYVGTRRGNGPSRVGGPEVGWGHNLSVSKIWGGQAVGARAASWGGP